MPKVTRRFQIMLSPAEHEALTALAERLECSRGFILRQSLQFRLKMENDHIPMCANGQRCYAPHLHLATHQGPPQ